MKLYEITNGYYGESYVRVLVIADTDDEAIELAVSEYKKVAARYGEAYYAKLHVNILCEDVSKSWNGKVVDG